MNPPSSSAGLSTSSTEGLKEAGVIPRLGKKETMHLQKGKSGHKALTIARVFTTVGSDPLEHVTYEKRTSRITNTDGSIVFEMQGAEIPAAWSQVATDIVVSKYFRKAGVPQYDADGNVMKNEKGETIFGPERSVKQVIRRLAGCWRHWGETYGYFETRQDAQAFEDELSYMLVHQMAAPNSPQWFNTGLHTAYGITGPAQGHYYCEPETGEVKRSTDAYTHPQPHACFIQSVDDDMVNEGGIMDLWVREARLFKFGSGTGTNFSKLRGAGEPLSGGGKSSGLMSFLKIGDRAAGAIKSGGTTRRAAKMVCLDLDHPDIEEFISWKVNEEKKVAALAKSGYDTDFNGEAYLTVSGQNSNNSIRVPQTFFEALEKDSDWQLLWRTELKKAAAEGRAAVPKKSIKARDLWDQISYAAWSCADPGVQFDTTINDWHTCPADGRINASNPCSEYMFLDNTACNLASINLLRFYASPTPEQARQGDTGFQLEKFIHAVHLWTVVLEVSVLMAQFPSREIAELSYKFRTLGLGYANLGAMLMQMGIPYDSPKGRAICGAITAIMTGESYATSADMAQFQGAFPGFEPNREHMLRVIRNHRRAAYNTPAREYEDLHVTPVGIQAEDCPGALLHAAKEAWDRALAKGEKHGYRNAQVTVIAPTGTIGLLMDCDTTGVEPDFALVKFKKLAGGGYMKIANQSVAPALRALAYSDAEVHDIMRYVMGTLSLEGAPHVNRASLKQKGFTDEDIAAVEKNLPQVFDLSFAFNKWTFGDKTMERLGFSVAQTSDPAFNLLRALGFSAADIEEANVAICGHMTVEGAPLMKDEHLPVFDCANKCGKIGRRFITAEGHIRMMAASQPFISGAISKTINLPNEATVEDVKNAYLLSWKLGIKANALYRDGSKMSQALNTSSDVKAEVQTIEKIIIKEVPRRRKLPQERMAIAHKFSVAGHEGYVHVGMYEDGTPGEIFIKMSKEGSTLSGVMDTLALSLSMNLQYGVPLDVLCEKLAHTRFEPMGMTTNKEIPMVKSMMDYLGRWMALKFLPKEKAKQLHNSELVERAYASGTKSKEAFAMRLAVVDEGSSMSMPFEAEHAVSAPEVTVDDKMSQAKLQGYTGSMCGGCGSFKLKRNGSCEVCVDCGATSGCS